ncbi:acyl-CoA synthetase FdrA [Irregularibacter muris]|uniref:Acyl-CoA synthetase FdrA n=1 Tax=Irregularibacter muris TaxID=1796619 RepID=A0AAE3HH15_9FIRM|nr:acyl-CoA synthetase FdrA [Irregularibacter muris]MCR1899289.1 acyl-CoA synthetase FdrA [Irregularibacter muris]
MAVHVQVKKNTYYDSVTLMIITKEVKNVPGVKEVLVGMATDLNKELSGNLNLLTPEIEELTNNDFYITVDAESEEAFNHAVEKVDELLNKKAEDQAGDYKPPTFDSAYKTMSDANLAVISIPGEYAAAEARKALEKDMHVMLFSDNVPLDQELELKKYAHDKGLLVMGPDCGTAILNGIPLCFANVVKDGDIGMVGASGTGIQEVSAIIGKLGSGITQAIGTGGRDLKTEIGGIMMLDGIRALQNDPKTKVIVVISKPPAKEVMEKVLGALKESEKPAVVHFIGGDPEVARSHGAYAGLTLEDTAYKAVALSRGEEVKDVVDFTVDKAELEKKAQEEVGKYAKGQKYLRGLYSGGTLAYEALEIMLENGKDGYSNIPLKKEYKLQNSFQSKEHTVLDLGEDEFTVGKPHPMIDPSTRIDVILKEAKDPEVAVILLDFVIGYGANPDIVGEILPGILQGRELAQKEGRHITFVAFVCGTNEDPQNLKECEARLRENGVIVLPSNAQAIRFSEKLISSIK